MGALYGILLEYETYCQCKLSIFFLLFGQEMQKVTCCLKGPTNLLSLQAEQVKFHTKPSKK